MSGKALPDRLGQVLPLIRAVLIQVPALPALFSPPRPPAPLVSCGCMRVLSLLIPVLSAPAAVCVSRCL